MKKIIVFASALALAGGASYAMEEDGMDKDMMMEAPAPSVTVSGSGAMGFENVDSGDDATDGIKLIREYKVAFSSSGTTDGGLMFGAGININDTEDNDPHQSVGGASVYVGAADGSWKLQFGGNDPGIDLAGGIGVADDNFGGEDDESIALSGSIEGASYRITMANPSADGAADGDWSIGASYSISDISVGVGMDSESGLAIGVGTSLAGLSTSVYYSKAEAMGVDVDSMEAYGGKAAVAAVPAVAWSKQEAYFVAQAKALEDWKTYVTTTEHTGVVNPFAAPADEALGSDDQDARLDNIKLFNQILENAKMGMGTVVTTDQNTALGTFTAELTNVTDTADVDETTLPTAADTAITAVTLRANGRLTAAQGTAITAITVNPATHGYKEAAEVAEDAIPAAANVLAGTTAYTGFGGKVSVPAGEGTSFSIAYSTFKADTMPEDDVVFRDSEGMTVEAYGGGSVKTTLIELGVSYDLGGGATLNAGIDKKSAEKIEIDYNEDRTARVGTKSTEDTTTLSASVAFSF